MPAAGSSPDPGASPAGHGWAYEKLKRKVGDYATAAAAVILTVSGGKIATCAIGLTNVAETALFAKDAADAAIGTAATDDTGEPGMAGKPGMAADTAAAPARGAS